MIDFNNTEDLREALHSGYIVKLRNGDLKLVTRVGQFTKILTNGKGYTYVSSYNKDLTIRPNILLPKPDGFDIVEVYGLIKDREKYEDAVSHVFDITSREVLWRRRPTLEFTMKQLCEMLNADVKIIDGDN